jgi:hypothetical protein
MTNDEKLIQIAIAFKEINFTLPMPLILILESNLLLAFFLLPIVAPHKIPIIPN